MQGRLRYDHYRVLGITRDAPHRAVKQAYRERVKLCHPDRDPSPEAVQRFQAVQEAYETLRNAELRLNYDAQLAGYRHVHDIRSDHPYQRPQPTRRYTTGPDRPVNRFAFIGLHLTGLCFGVTLITGILVGITFMEWPLYLVVFGLPGAVVIPDSLAGLRSTRSPDRRPVE